MRSCIRTLSSRRRSRAGSRIFSGPPSVEPADPETMVRMTYKLTPRTIRLIDELARTHYDNAGQAISACLKTLSMKKIS